MDATAAMSGPGAPADVALAVELLGRAGVDMILIARGGGAKSHLAAWESRPVALAITGCPVPIWTALGHATDHTLADSLARLATPTPSAAAAALALLPTNRAPRTGQESSCSVVPIGPTPRR